MAASGWSGFSDDELKRLKSSSDRNESSQGAGLPAGKMAKKFQYQPPKNPPRQVRASSNDRPIDPAAQLSRPHGKQPPDKAKSTPGVVKQNGRVESTTKSEHSTAAKGPEKDKPVAETRQAPEQDKDGNPEILEDGKEDMKVLDEKEILSMELANIANFQKQQQAMEELNKQKKKQLMQALEQRRKKAKAEAVKLTDIQKELSHLDMLLSGEVSILRDKIEEASMHFLEAQKRYVKAEKEFVDAKIDLHHKSQNKERLTEHLYTIIYQNEMRKSKKLAELMEKLEMECSAEDLTVDLPPLPHASMMSSIQTLGPHGPVSPSHFHHSLSSDKSDGAQKSPVGSPVVMQPLSPGHVAENSSLKYPAKSEEVSSASSPKDTDPVGEKFQSASSGTANSKISEIPPTQTGNLSPEVNTAGANLEKNGLIVNPANSEESREKTANELNKSAQMNNVGGDAENTGDGKSGT